MSTRDLRMPEIAAGALLQEAVRYALHRGCASAILNRVAAGMSEWLQEAAPKDAALVAPLAETIAQMSVDQRKRETEYYAADSVKST